MGGRGQGREEERKRGQAAGEEGRKVSRTQAVFCVFFRWGCWSVAECTPNKKTQNRPERPEGGGSVARLTQASRPTHRRRGG